MIAESDTLIFFSPFVMPVYSYDAKRNDVVDETQIAMQLLPSIIASTNRLTSSFCPLS